MKTIKQIITIIAVAIFMLGTFNVSAQKNNPYNSFGIEHNLQLDFIYNKIINTKQTNSKDFLKETLNEINFTSFKEKLTKDDINNAIEQVDDIITLPLSSTGPTFPKNLFSTQFEKTTNTIYNFTLLNDSNGLLNIVDVIKKSKLVKSEKKQLYIITSIAYNSLNYWNNNISKWSKLNNTQSKKAPPAAQIAGADVGGAIAGAIVGGVTTGGLASGPMALAAGFTCSAATAMVHLVNWLWS